MHWQRRIPRIIKLSIDAALLARKSVAVFEAKNRFSELLAAVEQGDQVTITRRGVPVARLVAEGGQGACPADQRSRVEAALARLRQIRAGLELPGDLKAIAREGLDRCLSIRQIASLPITVDRDTPGPAALLSLALRHDLTSHDAAYLELALRLQLPLATRDAALMEAAVASGVGLLAA